MCIQRFESALEEIHSWYDPADYFFETDGQELKKEAVGEVEYFSDFKCQQGNSTGRKFT